MKYIATPYQITTPLDHYQSVQGSRSHSEKDALVVKLVRCGADAAVHGGTAEDTCQAQLEVLETWCMAPPRLTEGQRILLKRLFSIPGITRICLLSLEPVFDFYAVGAGDGPDIYDQISAAVVDYKYDYRCSAAYMYMTEAEYAACDTRGILYVYQR